MCTILCVCVCVCVLACACMRAFQSVFVYNLQRSVYLSFRMNTFDTLYVMSRLCRYSNILSD